MEIPTMKTYLSAVAVVLLAVTGGSATAGHHHGHHGDCPECGQPPMICVPKVEKKPIKKTVYEVKCIPVCEHAHAKHHDCNCCPTCHLFYKKVLVKKEIECGEKCTVVC